MKAIKLSIFWSLQFVSSIVFSQIKDGLYVDNNHETFLYKNGDTIGLRLEMKSAIICYGLFWGNVKVNKHELILIKNISMKELTKLNIDSTSDEKVLINIDSSTYPSLIIKTEKKKSFEFIGDSNGVIEISQGEFERMRIEKQKVELQATTVFSKYYITSQLKLKRKYTISSLLSYRKNYKLINFPLLQYSVDGNALTLSGNEIYKSELQYLKSKSLTLEEFFMLE